MTTQRNNRRPADVLRLSGLEAAAEMTDYLHLCDCTDDGRHTEPAYHDSWCAYWQWLRGQEENADYDSGADELESLADLGLLSRREISARLTDR